MKILFFGGTKFFGKLILKKLVYDGHDLTVVSRHNAHPLKPLRQLYGDRNDPKILEIAKREGPFDVTIDNIAYYASDVSSALTIPTKHYILTSTIGVNYLNSQYAWNKKKAENVVIESCKVPWTIIRPGIVYGPDDPIGRHLYYIKKLLGGVAVPIGRHSHKLSFVFSEDLPNAYLSAVSTGITGVFELVQREQLTLIEYLRAHAQYFKICAFTTDVTREGPFNYDGDFISDRLSSFNFNSTKLNWEPTPWVETVSRAAAAPWLVFRIASKYL